MYKKYITKYLNTITKHVFSQHYDLDAMLKHFALFSIRVFSRHFKASRKFWKITWCVIVALEFEFFGNKKSGIPNKKLKTLVQFMLDSKTEFVHFRSPPSPSQSASPSSPSSPLLDLSLFLFHLLFFSFSIMFPSRIFPSNINDSTANRWTLVAVVTLLILAAPILVSTG